jgi:hypothetical protein
MGFREVIIKQSVAESIAEISWYLESEGLLATAEKFTDDAYDFIQKLGIIEKDTAPAWNRSEAHWDINASHIKKSIRLYLLN